MTQYRAAEQAAYDAFLQGTKRVVAPVAAERAQQIGFGIHAMSIRLRRRQVHRG